jgi:tetratricopeptide (TPR) repeat protein
VGRLNYSLPLALQDPEAARRMAESLIGQHAWAGYAAMANVESIATGDLSKSLYWSLRAYQEDPQDEFSNRAIILILAQVGEFEEARRISDSNAQIPDIYVGRWEAAIARLRRSRDADPLNNTIQLNLADALHLAGRFEEAQALYAELQARLPNGLVVDTLDTSTRPMLRMAYGYRLAGDEAAVAELLAAFRADLGKRKSAGVIYCADLAAMAMAAALEGDDEASLAALRTTFRNGLRDPLVLREPCMQRLADDPRFVSLRAEFEALIAAERSRVLELICEENPVPTTWQPTKETCRGQAAPTRT